MRKAIPWCIGVLLFLAVLRILRASQSDSFKNGSVIPDLASLRSVLGLVLLSQVALPAVVYITTKLAGLPLLWCLAATLVAGASPISGCPNLALLLGGNGALALRWLMLGTALLPITCLPILYLLFPAQSATIMLLPALILLALIGSSVLLAVLVFRLTKDRAHLLPLPALDGASAVVLAMMVIGLMSGLHDPSTGWKDVISMLMLACSINASYQVLGVIASRLLKQDRFLAISSGVSFGNRNIGLYLSALPAVQMEPLLLFIACYQIPMYLTPLIGDLFYSRLE